MVLYIFLDESGNFDFSNKPGASEWLGLTSLSTTDPEEGLRSYFKTKYELLMKGHDVFCFHATEDSQIVRNKFLPVISSLRNARIDSLAIRKRRLHPTWRDLHVFYPCMMEYLFKYVFHPFGTNVSKFNHVLIFLARMQIPKGQMTPMMIGIKRFLKQHLHNVPYTIGLHPSISHPYLQMVDYCSWVLYIKRARKELRPWKEIKHLVKSDFDIFARGFKNWY